MGPIENFSVNEHTDVSAKTAETTSLNEKLTPEDKVKIATEASNRVKKRVENSVTKIENFGLSDADKSEYNKAIAELEAEFKASVNFDDEKIITDNLQSALETRKDNGNFPHVKPNEGLTINGKTIFLENIIPEDFADLDTTKITPDFLKTAIQRANPNFLPEHSQFLHDAINGKIKYTESDIQTLQIALGSINDDFKQTVNGVDGKYGKGTRAGVQKLALSLKNILSVQPIAEESKIENTKIEVPRIKEETIKFPSKEISEIPVEQNLVLEKSIVTPEIVVPEKKLTEAITIESAAIKPFIAEDLNMDLIRTENPIIQTENLNEAIATPSLKQFPNMSSAEYITENFEGGEVIFLVDGSGSMGENIPVIAEQIKNTKNYSNPKLKTRVGVKSFTQNTKTLQFLNQEKTNNPNEIIENIPLSGSIEKSLQSIAEILFSNEFNSNPEVPKLLRVYSDEPMQGCDWKLIQSLQNRTKKIKVTVELVDLYDPTNPQIAQIINLQDITEEHIRADGRIYLHRLNSENPPIHLDGTNLSKSDYRRYFAKKSSIKNKEFRQLSSREKVSIFESEYELYLAQFNQEKNVG